MSELDRDLDRNAEATNRLRDVVGRLGQKDLERSLGDGWTVGFALVHLAFWDARQHLALQRFARGEGFPSEDVMTNATLESMASVFRADAAGDAAVWATEQLDATVRSLTDEQRSSLRDAGFEYAIKRWPHREEHLAQVEERLAAL